MAIVIPSSFPKIDIVSSLRDTTAPMGYTRWLIHKHTSIKTVLTSSTSLYFRKYNLHRDIIHAANFFNNGPQILKLIVRVRIYHIFSEIQLSRWKGWDPFKRLTLPYICACPNTGPIFWMSYVVLLFYVQSVLSSKVAVRYFDIEEIVDHYCLKFVSIIDFKKQSTKILTAVP